MHFPAICTVSTACVCSARVSYARHRMGAPLLTSMLSVELLEEIGRHLQHLPTIGILNRALALRCNATAKKLGRIRVFSSVFAMIHPQIIRGGGYGGDPLLFKAIAALASSFVKSSEMHPPPPASVHVFRGAVAVAHAQAQQQRSCQCERWQYGSMHHQQTEHAVLSYLVDSCPQALLMQDGVFRSPLHLALACRTHHTNIRLLMPRDPSALLRLLLAVDDCADTPLHVALQTGSDPSVVAMLVDHPHQRVLEMKNGYGFTPLHAAVFYDKARVYGAPVVRLLRGECAASPCGNQDLLLETDTDGETPLHLALFSGKAQPDVVRLLVDTRGLVLCTQSEKEILVGQNMFECQRDTPLQMALQAGLPLEILQLLVDAEQDVLRMPNTIDNSGDFVLDTPLHHALKQGRPLAVVEILVDTRCQVLLMENHCLDLPLHTALKCGAAVEVIAHLVHRARHIVDFLLLLGVGNETALHVAVRHHASAAVVQLLLGGPPVHDRNGPLASNRASQCPLLATDDHGHTPCELAVLHAAPPSVVYLLSGTIFGADDLLG